MNLIGRALITLVTMTLYVTIDLPIAIFTKESI